MSRDKLLAAEECKEILRVQMAVLTEDLTEANAKLKQQALEIEELRDVRDKEIVQVRESFVEELEKRKAEFAAELEQSHGAYFALKLAHSHLDAKLKASDANKIKQDSQIETYKINMVFNTKIRLNKKKTLSLRSG